MCGILIELIYPKMSQNDATTDDWHKNMPMKKMTYFTTYFLTTSSFMDGKPPSSTLKAFIMPIKVLESMQRIVCIATLFKGK